jgi:hypothetical protein
MDYKELTEGDPWTVIPVQSLKYAKDCVEVVLSNRNITKLVNFEDFENLEALWLTNNNVKYFNLARKNRRTESKFQN